MWQTTTISLEFLKTQSDKIITQLISTEMVIWTIMFLFAGYAFKRKKILQKQHTKSLRLLLIVCVKSCCFLFPWTNQKYNIYTICVFPLSRTKLFNERTWHRRGKPNIYICICEIVTPHLYVHVLVHRYTEQHLPYNIFIMCVGTD